MYHQERRAAARGRMGGAAGGRKRYSLARVQGEEGREVWERRAGLLCREEAALELEPDGSGVLSASFGIPNWPGRLLHSPALSGQSPCTHPSGWPARTTQQLSQDHRGLSSWQDSISCGPSSCIL